MNKHLLQSRLKSLAHYNEEVLRLEEAKRITISTREEVMISLKEFFPFKKGDVLVIGKTMLRAVELRTIYDCDAPSFMIGYEQPVTHYGKTAWERSQYDYHIRIADLDKVKVIDASIFETPE